MKNIFILKKAYAQYLAALFSFGQLCAQQTESSQPAFTETHYSPGSSSGQNYYAAGGIRWLTNYQEAVFASQSSSKPIVILFTGTNWCPACMSLERRVLTHPEFKDAVGQKFIFLKAEFPDYSQAASSPYKPLLDHYGINEFPSIVVINASGQVLFTVKYRDGGPQAYAKEMLQKLSSFSNP